MENVAVEQNIAAKVTIEISKDEACKDFTFVVPDKCTYLNAKNGAIALFEHIVRLEDAAARAEAAKAPAEPVVEEVTPSLVEQ